MSKYLQSITGHYTGWFLPEHAQKLEEVLLASAFEAVPGRAVLDAHHFAGRLTPVERHELAVSMEEVLQAAGYRRFEEADPDMWMSLRGRERSASPLLVSPAEELAVMALWKAVALDQLQHGFGAAIGELVANGKDSEGLHELLVGIQIQRHRDITRLVYEVTRAATLAGEAATSEKPRPPSLAEAQDLLREARREQSRKGAAARAVKYEWIRQRVVELYRRTPRRSRDETASEIHTFLQQEGIGLAWTTVRKYLADHDADVERSRN